MYILCFVFIYFVYFRNVAKLEEGIGEKVGMFIHFVTAFLGCIALAFANGWELTLICLVSMPVTMISIGIVATVRNIIRCRSPRLNSSFPPLIAAFVRKITAREIPGTFSSKSPPFHTFAGIIHFLRA